MINSSRWRNYGLWVSLLAFVPMLLKAFDINILPGNYDELASALLGILVLAGIINNPTDGKWFGDTKEKIDGDITGDEKKQ